VPEQITFEAYADDGVAEGATGGGTGSDGAVADATGDGDIEAVVADAGARPRPTGQLIDVLSIAAGRERSVYVWYQPGQGGSTDAPERLARRSFCLNLRGHVLNRAGLAAAAGGYSGGGGGGGSGAGGGSSSAASGSACGSTREGDEPVEGEAAIVGVGGGHSDGAGATYRLPRARVHLSRARVATSIEPRRLRRPDAQDRHGLCAQSL
jgi:hypothetical protein